MQFHVCMSMSAMSVKRGHPPHAVNGAGGGKERGVGQGGTRAAARHPVARHEAARHHSGGTRRAPAPRTVRYYLAQFFPFITKGTLPLITGYLAMGVVVGPYVTNMARQWDAASPGMCMPRSSCVPSPSYARPVACGHMLRGADACTRMRR